MEVHGFKDRPALLPALEQFDELGFWIFPVLRALEGAVGHEQSVREIRACPQSQVENEEI